MIRVDSDDAINHCFAPVPVHLLEVSPQTRTVALVPHPSVQFSELLLVGPSGYAPNKIADYAGTPHVPAFFQLDPPEYPYHYAQS